MESSDPNSSRHDFPSLARAAAETILKLDLAGRLLGGSVRAEGFERVMLVSAIRSGVEEGVDEPTLHALADFVPIAFMRAALADSGVSLPDHLGRKDSIGRIREYRRLDDVAIYRDALALAQEWRSDRADDVLGIARWNGAMRWIENALARGSKAGDLEVAPTLLDGPDEACPPLEDKPTLPDQPWCISSWRPKPWWKFW